MKGSNADRRSFLKYAAVGAVAVGSQLMLSACGGSGGSTTTSAAPTNGGNCLSNGSDFETTSTTESHSHTIQLSASDIQNATPSTTFTTSSVGHTHSVQLTSQQISDLQNNVGVSLVTGAAITDGHTHSLSISCA